MVDDLLQPCNKFLRTVFPSLKGVINLPHLHLSGPLNRARRRTTGGGLRPLTREAPTEPRHPIPLPSPGSPRTEQKHKRTLARVAMVLLLFLLTVPATWAEKRAALVIGNDSYDTLSNLSNAGRDARGMASKLKALGFETTLLLDVKRRDFHEALDAFEDTLNRSDVGLVFFAGHGIQTEPGQNYLIPSDAQLEKESHLPSEAVRADAILKRLERAENRVSILILDACRNNPLPNRGRSARRGLQRMDPEVNKDFAILYSAGPGQVAQDGPPGGHGVFTGELLRALDEPGLKLEDVFKKVAKEVLSKTNNRQRPWQQVSMVADFRFNPPPATVLGDCPDCPGRNVHRFDTNGDAQIDQWEYYDSGVLARLEKDRDYDRRVDHWVTYQDGKAVQAEFDTNGSGTVDQREFYDADGILQRVINDQDGNGTFEQQFHYAPGNRPKRLEKDTNGDGHPDQWHTFEQGRLARIALDQDFNGKPEQWQSYDASGATSLIEIDSTGNDKVDQWHRYTDGKVGQVGIDEDADGKIDQIIHYDGEGRIARALQNLDAEGKPHVWMEYKEGVLASSAFDTTNNGEADQWHHYHAGGHVERIEYDQSGDGRPDQWEHFEPGSSEPHRVEQDTTGDGNADTVWER